MKARVLLAHNFYNSALPSGETMVVAAERGLLRQHGHKVSEFYRYSDALLKKGKWGSIKGAFSTPWNLFSAQTMRQMVADNSPEIVHVHNTFPLLSPGVFHAIGSRAARVLTLHNYRLFCAAAIPSRAGKICTQCLDRRSVWPALRFGCYRNSRLATTPLAVSVGLHRLLGTWSKQVDAFIVLTKFQKDLMVKAGLPNDLVHVKPNFFPGMPKVLAWKKRRNTALFVGRLSAEKGVQALLRAWLMWGPSAPELRLVGEGGLKARLMRLAATASDVPIRFLGHLPAKKTCDEIARSKLLVLPSNCYEGFPMVLGEAFAFGTPAAVSNLGALPEIVHVGENGLVFEPENPRSLLATVQQVWRSAGVLEQLANGARQSFEAEYTEAENYNALMDIYQQAMQKSRHRAAR